MVLALVGSSVATAQTAYPYPYPRTRRNSTGVPITDAEKNVAGTFHGTLKELSNKEIVIQNEDDQTVVIRRSKKTKFLMDNKQIKASAIAMDSLVTVEAREDIDLKPIAVSLSIDVPKIEQLEERPKQ